MPLDLAALRPAYNGTALAAATFVTPYWAHVLANIGATGDGSGPFGATVIGLAAAAVADLTMRVKDANGQVHGLWIPRVALFTVALGPLYSPHTAALMLNFLAGAAS
ncbi:hypothetical protein E6W39_24300 [Kitasatospora acidiphila]|uniref:Uncharacterized protein n=1 Tax=Kitasatospora acidiphila TaxID=2567942 RepID=A0A540W732_9ACTN|nr:hypothetical protein [Kitasatospora acidiphila]TQF04777.1 hypothetical protein E6W39_24300 [Kitasatospora acidiphila]